MAPSLWRDLLGLPPSAAEVRVQKERDKAREQELVQWEIDRFNENLEKTTQHLAGLPRDEHDNVVAEIEGVTYRIRSIVTKMYAKAFAQDVFYLVAEATAGQLPNALMVVAENRDHLFATHVKRVGERAYLVSSCVCRLKSKEARLYYMPEWIHMTTE